MSQGRGEDQLPGVYRTGLSSWVRWWPLNNMDDVCSISWVVGDSDICNVYHCSVWSQAFLESSSCIYIRLAHLFFLWVKWQELPLGLAEKCWRNNSLCCCDHKYANLQITLSCKTNIRNCTQDETFTHWFKQTSVPFVCRRSLAAHKISPKCKFSSYFSAGNWFPVL